MGVAAVGVAAVGAAGSGEGRWGWPAVEMAGGGGGQVVGMGGGAWPGSGDRGKMAVSRDLDSSRGSCPLQPLLVTVRKCRRQIAQLSVFRGYRKCKLYIKYASFFKDCDWYLK